MNKEEIHDLADLAKLKLDDEHEELFAKQIDNIVKMMDVLQKVDVDHVEPISFSCPAHGIKLRKDEVVSEPSDNEGIFANTTHELAKEVKCFITPKVIK